MSTSIERQNLLAPEARLIGSRHFTQYFGDPRRVASIAARVNRPERRIFPEDMAFFDDRAKLAGGALIATLSTLGVNRRILGVGEALGFLGFYSAMTLTSKIQGGIVQMLTGVPVGQKYLSPDNLERKLFQDPRYLALHLLSDERINKIADRLHVDKNLPPDERRRMTEEKIGQVAGQSMLWWMLIAGPSTAVIGSVIAHVLEDPAKRAIGALQGKYHEGMLRIAQSAEAQNAHLQKAVATRLGEISQAKLSGWWDRFGQGVAQQSGLTRAFTGPEIMKIRQDAFLGKLTDYFHAMSRDGDQTVAKGLSQYLEGQEKAVDLLEKDVMTLLDANKSVAAQHGLRGYAQDRLTTARATVGRYRVLLDAIAPGKNPSRESIRSLLADAKLHVMERIMGAHPEQGVKLAGSEALFADLRTAITQKQYKRAERLLGDSLDHHLRGALSGALRKSMWRKRVIGAIGGAVALTTLAYTGLFMGRNTPKSPIKMLSAEQMLGKYDQGDFAPEQAEFQRMQQIQQTLGPLPPSRWQNHLKRMFQNNQAVVYALNIRTFGATDVNHDGTITKGQENGTFLSSIRRLDELKAMGVNTIHLLPITAAGQVKRFGDAGSLYATGDLLSLNNQFDTPGNGANVYQEARAFIDECHKRGINVMVDVPSVASIDLALRRPDLIATDAQGRARVPTTWSDIVNFENNPALEHYYRQYFDLMANKLGVDGFRVDVARSRTLDFWKRAIERHPDKAWLAETYTYEAASPMPNLNRDDPLNHLKVGFDSIYGQLHIFHEMRTAGEFLNYLLEANRMFKMAGGQGKSMIGSFLTHDDPKTLMAHGGVINSNLVSGLMATIPYTNPYIMDGFPTGDEKALDIFNYKDRPKGQHPEIGAFMTQMFNLRRAYGPILTNGLFIPLPVYNNPGDQVIAFARQFGGRTMLVVANKDVNARSVGKIYIPTLAGNQPLVNLAPEYGRASGFKIDPAAQAVEVNLGPGRFHMFEINTPLLPYQLRAYQ